MSDSIKCFLRIFGLILVVYSDSLSTASVAQAAQPFHACYAAIPRGQLIDEAGRAEPPYYLSTARESGTTVMGIPAERICLSSSKEMAADCDSTQWGVKYLANLGEDLGTYPDLTVERKALGFPRFELEGPDNTKEKNCVLKLKIVNGKQSLTAGDFSKRKEFSGREFRIEFPSAKYSKTTGKSIPIENNVGEGFVRDSKVVYKSSSRIKIHLEDVELQTLTSGKQNLNPTPRKAKAKVPRG